MPKKNLLVAGLIVFILVLIGISFGYGYRLGEEKPARIQILGLETSKVIRVQHALASGEVIEILDRALTLVANGDTLAIPIIEEVRVTTLVLEREVEEEARVEQREIEFKDIKVGDKVDVLIELKPDGYFEGIDVTVLPE